MALSTKKQPTPKAAAHHDKDTDATEQEQQTNLTFEEEAVQEASHMSAKLIYQVVRREGVEELRRPTVSLFWSGIAAGVCISFSVLGEAVFATHMPDVTWLPLIESLGYTFGFLIVIMGRMQLFTENTLTTVLPILAKPSKYGVYCVGRLWAIVLAANIVGAFIAAVFIAYIPAFDPEFLENVRVISVHATEHPAGVAFAKAIPAGLLIAALVWMLAAGEHNNFFLIIVMTWLIAAGGFTHIIAGSVEMAYLIVTGELGIFAAIFRFFIPVLLGNIFGGTLVFALITWGQVREEVAARD